MGAIAVRSRFDFISTVFTLINGPGVFGGRGVTQETWNRRAGISLSKTHPIYITRSLLRERKKERRDVIIVN